MPEHQYVITGRRKPTVKHPEHECPVFRMKLFAPDSVIARSRFWYKEYRDVTLTGAVAKMYADLASKHRARRSSIQIVKTAVIKASDSRRAYTQQYHTNSIAFKLLHRIPRPSSRSFRSTFKATRPSTFF